MGFRALECNQTLNFFQEKDGFHYSNCSTVSEDGFVKELRCKEKLDDDYRRRTSSLRRRSSRSGSSRSNNSGFSDFRKPDDLESNSGSSTCSQSTLSTSTGISSSTNGRRRSMRRGIRGSDADSLLSTLSIDDSLSGRSTPPRSRVSISSNNNGAPAKAEVDPNRPSPLPPVTFGDHKQIWEMMCITDCKYRKDANLFKNHPVLTPQMRSILLDWIMDVCEAYHLHRETMYLAIDYLDRYLATQNNVLKNHLQLIGKLKLACHI